MKHLFSRTAYLNIIYKT